MRVLRGRARTALVGSHAACDAGKADQPQRGQGAVGIWSRTIFNIASFCRSRPYSQRSSPPVEGEGRNTPMPTFCVEERLRVGTRFSGFSRRAYTTLMYCAAFCVASILIAAMFAASTPIPYDAEGHVLLRRGSRDSALKVDVYIDLACADCKAAWPVMTQIARDYDEQVEFLYRVFPLPYHRNAFTAALAAQVVRRFSGADPESLGSFIAAVFDNQDQILNEATAEMTQPQIEDLFEIWATSSSGMSTTDFKRGMVDAGLDRRARFEFKYGCLHNVYGTPLVFIGGVQAADLDGDADVGTWQNVLDPLLAKMDAKTSQD